MDHLKYNLNNISFEEIAKELTNGKLIIYPTDTVYGLGASIDNEDALKNIYNVKERDYLMPLIVLVDNFDKIEKVAKINKNNKTFKILKKLTDVFWPGALTVILEKKEDIPDIITSNGNTIGVRMPKSDIALDIIKAASGVLPTTSANISGEPTPSSYGELSEEIKKRVEILIDGGKCPISVASTIIDITCDTPKILRLGAISKKDIENVIGKIN
ncbi:MAG: threonylcarbamoyl-AMP synthase [Fusobacteriaceae bacterium]|jgi:L-threonylcarbamoyladenylate synthase|nr:threonylcarbamoyl-AMP synthase [Fusobacteriaceae bacterium]